MIATLAAQFILEDFFARAEWFSGGSYGASASPINPFGFEFSTDESFFYVAPFALIFMYLWASNLIRSRDGRAFVLVRDHYPSAEIMGINLTKYRLLSLECAFYAGIGGALYGHYLGSFRRRLHDHDVYSVPRDDHHRWSGIGERYIDGHDLHRMLPEVLEFCDGFGCI